jgi:hypothetical protein
MESASAEATMTMIFMRIMGIILRIHGGMLVLLGGAFLFRALHEGWHAVRILLGWTHRFTPETDPDGPGVDLLKECRFAFLLSIQLAVTILGLAIFMLWWVV